MYLNGNAVNNNTNPEAKRLIYRADFMANLYVFLKLIFICL